MSKLQLLVTAYSLQISLYDMKLKLAFWILLDKSICWSIILSIDVTFSKNIFYSVQTVLLPNLFRLNFNFILTFDKFPILDKSIACIEVNISSKKLHTRKYLQEKIM